MENGIKTNISKVSNATAEYLADYATTTAHIDEIVTEDDMTVVGIDMTKLKEEDIFRYRRLIAFHRLATTPIGNRKGMPLIDAYALLWREHSDLPKQALRSKVNAITRSKGYKDVADAMSAEAHAIFAHKRMQVINTLADMAMDSDVADRDRINAGDTFLKYTSKPEIIGGVDNGKNGSVTKEDLEMFDDVSRQLSSNAIEKEGKSLSSLIKQPAMVENTPQKV